MFYMHLKDDQPHFHLGDWRAVGDGGFDRSIPVGHGSHFECSQGSWNP
jgi:hypothetical protein